MISCEPDGAGGADRLGLGLVDVLDVLGQQLGEEADGRERQRQEAGERAEAEHRHEEDGDDDLLEGAADGDDGAADSSRPASGAMLRAAPMPIGIEMSTPTTVEVSVMVRLSIRPGWMSPQRLTKSGGEKALHEAPAALEPLGDARQLTSTRGDGEHEIDDDAAIDEPAQSSCP